MTSAQSWSRDWADVIIGLSRRHPCRFSDGYISLSTKHYYISFLGSSKTVTNYIYAKIQAEICMFSSQNSRGLNRAILRPLWLMTSAAADVISVPSVISVDVRECDLVGDDIVMKPLPEPLVCPSTHGGENGNIHWTDKFYVMKFTCIYLNCYKLVRYNMSFI